MIGSDAEVKAMEVVRLNEVHGRFACEPRVIEELDFLVEVPGSEWGLVRMVVSIHFLARDEDEQGIIGKKQCWQDNFLRALQLFQDKDFLIEAGSYLQI